MVLIECEVVWLFSCKSFLFVVHKEDIELVFFGLR